VLFAGCFFSHEMACCLVMMRIIYSPVHLNQFSILCDVDAPRKATGQIEHLKKMPPKHIGIALHRLDGSMGVDFVDLGEGC